jgi:hypothetical protein
MNGLVGLDRSPCCCICSAFRTAPGRCKAFDEIVAKHKPCMDWLKAHGKTTEWLRLRLLEEIDTYALTKDPGLQKLMESRGGIPYERQVYSLLISYGKVPAQSQHIDMVYPLYQGVLLLTPSPPTHVFPVQNVLNMSVEKLEVEDFVDLLGDRLGSLLSSAARNDLVKAIRADEDAVLLIERYGWLYALGRDKLNAYKQVIHWMPGEGEPFCGYVGLPGSVIHRGPPCAAFRLALFASYGQATDEPYKDSVQYTAPSLHANLSDMIYERLKTREAKQLFLDVGMQLLAEGGGSGPDDFLQYGADSSTWNPAKVTEGLLLATIQAHAVQKAYSHADSLGSRGRKTRPRVGEKHSLNAKEAYLDEKSSALDTLSFLK